MGQTFSNQEHELRAQGESFRRGLCRGQRVDADFVIRFNRFVKDCPGALEWKTKRGGSLLTALFSYLCSALERHDPVDHLQALVTPQTSKVFRMQDGLGWTLLHNACKLNPTALDIISFVVEQCPFATQIWNDWKQTPLHIACIHGASLPVVERLVEECPQAVNACDFQGQTPLHDHFTNGRASLDVTKLLAMKELAVCLAQDGDGDLPLDVAKSCKNGEPVVEFLSSITNAVAGVVMDEILETKSTLDQKSVDLAVNCGNDRSDKIDLIRLSLTNELVCNVLQRSDVRSRILARTKSV